MATAEIPPLPPIEAGPTDLEGVSHTFAVVQGEYRYWLRRRLGDAAFGRPRAAVVMVNPSTADQESNDNTMKRLLSFARRERWATLDVVNLFAWRSPYPTAMDEARSYGADVVGPHNDRFIEMTVEGAEIVVVAWGVVKLRSYRSERADRVLNLLRQARGEGELVCFGRTASGCPRHPLYLPDEAELEVFDGQ